MPLTPRSRVYEEKLANTRKKYESRNAFASERARKATESFSAPSAKQPVINAGLRGANFMRGGLAVEGVKTLLDWDTLKSAAQEPASTAKGFGKLALLSMGPGAAAGVLGPKEALAAMLMQDSDVNKASAITGILPMGSVERLGTRGAAKALHAFSPDVMRFGDNLFSDIAQHGETDILSNAQEKALRAVDIPEIPNVQYTVNDARALVDTPEVLKGARSKKRVGEVPVHIDSQETANQVFFGDNVMDAGMVGNTVSSNPDFVGTTAHIGKRIDPAQIERDQISVARNGVKTRYGSRAPANGAGPKARATWASTTLNNFIQDFGEGTARILRSEGRRSIGGEFDEASTIPQTIQHDHTIVSPTDLKSFEEETKTLKKELGSDHPDVKERTKVAKDMRVILSDSRNLVPVHRNPNILLSSFDRERLLNDPEFATSLGISEDNLGDIWRIMSADDSGYRASVNAAYDFARQGGRADSVAYWQRWQNDNLKNTVARRNQRLMQSGIKLD